MSLVDHLDVIQQYVSEDQKRSTSNEEARQNALTAARALCLQIERPMDTLLRFAWIEPTYAACLKIALDIGLFQALGDFQDGVHRTIKDLAEVTKTDPELLGRILRSLTSMRTVAEVDAGTFAATEFSTALLDRRYSSAIDYRFMVATPLTTHLPRFLKETKYHSPKSLLDSPWQYAFQTKLSFFDWLGQNSAVLEMFTNHMAGYTAQRGTWESAYPIQDRLLSGDGDIDKAEDVILVDLGGGSGHDLKRFASNFLPHVKRSCLVLQDLPEVVDQANANVEFPSTIRVVPIDLTLQSPVPGARAYFLHSVLHDWPDQHVHSILQRIHSTLMQRTVDGFTPRLLINENVLLKRGVQPQPAALDIIMMAAFASHERTEDQWTTLLASAGYIINEIFFNTGVDEAVIEAVAVAS